MNTNVNPREHRIREARAIATTRGEFAKLINMSESGAMKVVKRMGLPLFQEYRGPAPADRNEKICEAYNTGMTFKAMKQTFGLSEGTLAGVLSRAGLLGRRIEERRIKKKLAQPKPEQRNRAARVPNFKIVPFDQRTSSAPFLGLDISQLNSTTCRNPDPQCDDPRAMTYCGQPVYGSLPYCLACASINYRPAEARERAPRPR